MILTVSALSAERYVAICHPFLVSQHALSSKIRTCKIIVSIWVVGFLCALPVGLQREAHRVYDASLTGSLTSCFYSTKIGIYLEGLRAIFFFFVPMILVAVMYVRIMWTLRNSAKTINNSHDLTRTSTQRAPKLLSIC